MADVSGHGVPAALVASMVKLAFSTQAEHANDPASVLTATNRALSRQLERSFVTAIYAVVDTDRCTITHENSAARASSPGGTRSSPMADGLSGLPLAVVSVRTSGMLRL